MRALSTEAAQLRRLLVESKVASVYKAAFGIPFLSVRLRFAVAVKMLEAPLRRKERLLDAGCSWGALVFELSRIRGGLEAIEFIGADLSVESLKDALKLARGLGAKAFYPVVANIQFLPFADSTFDRALCSEVLEHIADDSLAVLELERILRPSGRLVITVPNAEQKTARVSTSSRELFDHAREGYSLDGLRHLLESQKLRILRTKRVANLFGGAAWEVSFRLLSLFRQPVVHSVVEALTFPIFLAIAKLDSLSGERLWSKWLVVQVIKQQS